VRLRQPYLGASELVAAEKRDAAPNFVTLSEKVYSIVYDI
jgi:hypothetical protein